VGQYTLNNIIYICTIEWKTKSNTL